MDTMADGSQHHSSVYDEATFQRICERLAKGESLAKICNTKGFPAFRTVWEWQEAGGALSAALKHARARGLDAIAEECQTIADEVQPDRDHVAKARLRVDTRLRLLAIWDPKRFGPKAIVEAGSTLEQLVLEAQKRREMRNVTPGAESETPLIEGDVTHVTRTNVT